MNVPPAQSERPKLGYVRGLDGLRGLAILLVIGNHLPLGRYQALLPGGFAGVDIFFVLSGFLITTLLVEEFDGSGSISLRNFYARRMLRLGPALVVMLAVVVVSSLALQDAAHAEKNLKRALIALFYVSNWVRAFTAEQLGPFAHTWSLSLEEQFYIIWPGVLLLGLRRAKSRRTILFFAAALALASWLLNVYLAFKGVSVIQICYRSDTRADTLMIGCMLGLAFSSGLKPAPAFGAGPRFLRVAAPASLLVLIVFAVVGGEFLGRGALYYVFVVLAVLAAIVIFDVVMNPQSLVQRVLTMDWLVWLGKISYGLYLWHWAVFQMMRELGCSPVTITIAGTLVALAVSTLSYYALERPLLNLKRRFSRGEVFAPSHSGARQ